MLCFVHPEISDFAAEAYCTDTHFAASFSTRRFVSMQPRRSDVRVSAAVSMVTGYIRSIELCIDHHTVQGSEPCKADRIHIDREGAIELVHSFDVCSCIHTTTLHTHEAMHACMMNGEIYMDRP